MTEPILVAASELKDAIDSVYIWRNALVKYLREDISITDTKQRDEFIYKLEEGGSNVYDRNIDTELEYIEYVVDDVVKFIERQINGTND